MKQTWLKKQIGLCPWSFYTPLALCSLPELGGSLYKVHGTSWRSLSWPRPKSRHIPVGLEDQWTGGFRSTGDGQSLAGGAVLCTVGCVSPSLTSTHKISVVPPPPFAPTPSSDNQNVSKYCQLSSGCKITLNRELLRYQYQRIWPKDKIQLSNREVIVGIAQWLKAYGFYLKKKKKSLTYMLKIYRLYWV